MAKLSGKLHSISNISQHIKEAGSTTIFPIRLEADLAGLCAIA